jgi:hypothetical protein
LKAAGDPTEFVIKGALNSTYGVLAQNPKHNPKFRCVAWAGWITAATRAQLLDVLTDDVVLLATDGILTRAPLDVPVSERLGDWETDTYDEVWCAGTGVYFCRRADTWDKNKTRGFESGTLTRERVLEMWESDGRDGRTVIERHTFIGMGIALHRIHGMRPPHRRLWRTFQDQRIDWKLSMEPRRAWLTDDVRDGRTRAPSAKEAKAGERFNEGLVDEARERYGALLAKLTKREAAKARGLPVDVTNADRLMTLRAEAEEQRMLDRLLRLGSFIDNAERNLKSPLLITGADDPTVG